MSAQLLPLMPAFIMHIIMPVSTRSPYTKPKLRPRIAAETHTRIHRALDNACQHCTALLKARTTPPHSSRQQLIQNSSCSDPRNSLKYSTPHTPVTNTDEYAIASDAARGRCPAVAATCWQAMQVKMSKPPAEPRADASPARRCGFADLCASAWCAYMTASETMIVPASMGCRHEEAPGCWLVFR